MQISMFQIPPRINPDTVHYRRIEAGPVAQGEPEGT